MSFILDALDKAEEEKKGTVGDPVSRIEGGREFADSRRFAWTLTAMAIAAVSLSLAAFVWVQWQREREQRIAGQLDGSLAGTGAVIDSERRGSTREGRDENPFRYAAPVDRAAATENPPTNFEPATERVEIRRSASVPSGAAPAGSRSEAAAPAAAVEEDAPLPAMRLVGRNSAARSTAEPENRPTVRPQPSTPSPEVVTESEPTEPADEAASASPADESAPPDNDPAESAAVESVPANETASSDSPPSDTAQDSGSSGPSSRFSLQGTSVIDGRPVAVINEVRVFVGDWIGGARVVEITDREVRLDVDGTLVTLTL